LLEPDGVVSCLWIPPAAASVRSGSLHIWSVTVVAILGLALFGSRARQDGASDSDVDFLRMTTDRKPPFTVRKKLAVSTS
jgi:hypothetical protein